MVRSAKRPYTPASTTPVDIVPAPKQNRIPAIYLGELAAIWEVDKRTPSAASRRAWALARNLSPARVNNWWYRKKTTARKYGVVLPEETYELPVGIVPLLPRPPSSPASNPETLPKSAGLSPGPGLRFGFVKKEEPQPEYELALLSGSDDSNFSGNYYCSSNAPGSLGSDDNKFTVEIQTPYTTETSFFSSNGCMNAEEILNDKLYSAYIQSTGSADTSPPRGEFSGYSSYQSGSMLSQLYDSGTSGIGTRLVPYADVATGQNIALYFNYDVHPDQSTNVLAAANADDAWTLPFNQTNTLQPGFTCALCLPVAPVRCTNAGVPNASDPAQAVRANHEFESGYEDMVARPWDTERLDATNTVKLQLTTTTDATNGNRKRDSSTYRTIQDPNNFSWCLGGSRYSYDGFRLGLCECSETDTKDGFTFKRYLGCTGPWEPRPLYSPGSDDA